MPELEPWLVRVDFLVYVEYDDELPREKQTPRYEYVPVGCELARPITVDAANADVDTIGRDFPAILRRFTRKAEIYCVIAELRLRYERDELAKVRKDLWYGTAHKNHRLLVADYRSRDSAESRIDDMADDYGVHRTTIYRQLQEAAAKGLIDRNELNPRTRRRAAGR